MKNDFSELIEYLDKKFIKINSGFNSLKKELSNFKNETNTNFDKTFDDLETLKQEKTIGKYQDKRKKKFFGYVIRHMETGETSKEELEEISKLNIS
jgi:hypothetical protein